MELEAINLVDINQTNVEQTWPVLLEAVHRADFIALDLELSGLGFYITRRAFVADERYKLLREVANLYSIVSMGVACFHWQPETTPTLSVHCNVDVFNIWLLSESPYMVDPSSAKFLLQHGFDFNKQFSSGIRYTPVGSSNGDNKPTSFVDLFRRFLLSPAPLVVHNGWVDLMFLYHSFHACLPPTLDSMMADLAEMVGTGGVFDTKAITTYKLSEERSFLEYIYKKALIGNRRRANDVLCLELSVSEYPMLDCVERVELPQQPDIAEEDLVEIVMCPNFVRHGSCSSVDCARCHDVFMAILQEEHWKDVQRLKRKRKREQRNLKKSPEPAPTTLYTSQPRTEHPKTSAAIADLFKGEIATAKANLKLSPLTDSVRQSFGHRAGFDAFMTGYTFAWYALSTVRLKDHLTVSGESEGVQHLPVCNEHSLLKGLLDMKNCLSNRGKAVPMKVAQSKFSKTSEGHNAVWKTIKQSTDNVLTEC